MKIILVAGARPNFMKIAPYTFNLLPSQNGIEKWQKKSI
jgi:UDP-N-acetylglucosamine 2-epimerase